MNNGYLKHCRIYMVFFITDVTEYIVSVPIV